MGISGFFKSPSKRRYDYDGDCEEEDNYEEGDDYDNDW